MAVNCDFRVSKWLVAAILVAWAQFAIAPTAAQARCGDYVLLGGQAAHHPDQIDGAPVHRGPCSGPNCSNDGPRPIEAPAVPVETDVRDWGLIAAQHPLSLVVHQNSRFADDAVLPRIAMGAVFRPPR